MAELQQQIGYALSSTGNVYTWGANTAGQLGDGTDTASTVAVEVKGVGGTGHLSELQAYLEVNSMGTAFPPQAMSSPGAETMSANSV